MTLDQWIQFIPLFRLVLATLEGAGAVPIIDYLKNKIAIWRGGRPIGSEAAFALTFAVALLFAVLTLVVEGAVSPEAFGPEAIITTFVTIFSVAKVRFDMIRKRRAEVVDLGD